MNHLKTTYEGFLFNRKEIDESIKLVRQICSLFVHGGTVKFTRLLKLLVQRKEDGNFIFDNDRLKYHIDKFTIELNFSQEIKKDGDIKLMLFEDGFDEMRDVCYLTLTPPQKELFKELILYFSEKNSLDKFKSGYE